MRSAWVALLAASASSGLEFQEERVEWSRPQVTGDVPTPREGHCAHVVQQSLFIYGGSSSDLHMDLQDMHVLDLANMNWAAVDTCADNDATCYVPPKAARIAFEQEIIPFEEFEQFKMTLCAVQTGLDPIERQWVYYMGGKLPGKIEPDFVIGIFPNTQVYTGVPLNVYYRRVGGSRLLGAEDGVWPTDRPVVVGEKRVREE